MLGEVRSDQIQSEHTDTTTIKTPAEPNISQIMEHLHEIAQGVNGLYSLGTTPRPRLVVPLHDAFIKNLSPELRQAFINGTTSIHDLVSYAFSTQHGLSRGIYNSGEERYIVTRTKLLAELIPEEAVFAFSIPIQELVTIGHNVLEGNIGPRSGKYPISPYYNDITRRVILWAYTRSFKKGSFDSEAQLHDLNEDRHHLEFATRTTIPGLAYRAHITVVPSDEDDDREGIEIKEHLENRS